MKVCKYVSMALAVSEKTVSVHEYGTLFNFIMLFSYKCPPLRHLLTDPEQGERKVRTPQTGSGMDIDSHLKGLQLVCRCQVQKYRSTEAIFLRFFL